MENKVREILTAYLKHDLPDKLNAEIREWLFDGDKVEEKMSVLEDMFYNEVNFDKNPSIKTLRNYESISLVLGFDKEAPAVKKNNRLAPVVKIAMSIAAVALPIMILFGIFIYRDVFENDEMLLHELIAIADYKEATMVDGTYIRLYPGSRIEYEDDFESDRKLNLIGEADVKVVNNGDPFKVVAGDITVNVKGTEFHVKSYDMAETASVALYRGAVEVDADGVSTTIRPGQLLELDCRNRDVSLTYISEIDMRRYFNSYLAFQNTCLSDIFEAIEEAYDLEVEIVGDMANDIIDVDFTECVYINEIMGIMERIIEPFTYKLSDDKLTIVKK